MGFPLPFEHLRIINKKKVITISANKLKLIPEPPPLYPEWIKT
jgi:hypothetical protein